MVDIMEEVNFVGKKNVGNGIFAVLYCAIFRMPSFLGLPSPLWVQKQSTYRHSPYYLPRLLERVSPFYSFNLLTRIHDSCCFNSLLLLLLFCFKLNWQLECIIMTVCFSELYTIMTYLRTYC